MRERKEKWAQPAGVQKAADPQRSPSPEPAETLGHPVHWSGGRFKDNGATNHYQNNYVHLENDMEKSRIKLLYKFPTNEKMRAGMGGVEYPPQRRRGERGSQQVEVVGLFQLWTTLWTQSEGQLNIREKQKAQRLKNKTKTNENNTPPTRNHL